jgi:hypothetical protein
LVAAESSFGEDEKGMQAKFLELNYSNIYELIPAGWER